MLHAENPLLDYEESASGFLSPRNAKILDAEHRREQRQFEYECRKLYARQWAAEKRASDPEAAKAVRLAYKASHGDLIRDYERERSRRRRRGEQLPMVRNRCVECGGLWESQRASEFCSNACNKRSLYVKRKTRPSLRMLISAFLRANPGATSLQVAEGLKLNKASVFSWFQQAYRTGEVVDLENKGRYRRYALAVDGNKSGVSEYTLRIARSGQAANRW